MSDSSVIRLHHIEITVPRDQEAEALAFYRDFLGLPQIDKPESLRHRGGFWLKLANLDLHVGIEDGFDRNLTKAHLAYEVDNLAAWHEKIAARGLTIRESIPIPGYDRFEFRDPFGNRVEMIQRSGE